MGIFKILSEEIVIFYLALRLNQRELLASGNMFNRSG